MERELQYSEVDHIKFVAVVVCFGFVKALVAVCVKVEKMKNLLFVVKMCEIRRLTPVYFCFR